MILCEARPTQDIESFAAEMVKLAWDRQDTVLGEFNQHTLVAAPGSTRDDVMREWNEAQRRSYFGDDR